MASETNQVFPSLIYLMGYMGTGKSTVGQLLATRLNYNFIDLDSYIENHEENSIPNIFETKGEAYFREIEYKSLISVSSEKSVVVALGGGTPCFKDNIARINATGVSIWLYASPHEIFTRICADTKRPLIKNINTQDKLDYIENHIDSRKAYYTQADILVDAEQEVDQVVTSIINKLNNEA